MMFLIVSNDVCLILGSYCEKSQNNPNVISVLWMMFV